MLFADPPACVQGHELLVSDGVIDAMPPDIDLDPNTTKMFDAFGFLHARLERHPPEDELVFQRYFADVPFDRLSGGVALDAGCGSGRFSTFLAERMRTLVALDGSPAVRTAAKALASFPNAAVLRADLMEPPLADGSFDLVTCIGVLHHFTNPRAGLDSLARLLAPGGYILLFLYSKPRGGVRSFVVQTATALRRVSVRLPKGLVHATSVPLAAILWATSVLPGRVGERLGVRFLSVLPLRMYRDLPFHSLTASVFDALIAPIERRYTWLEVAPWFREVGLSVESVREDDGLVILAHPQRSDPS
jgi:SAM-dependent methyltransferase